MVLVCHCELMDWLQRWTSKMIVFCYWLKDESVISNFDLSIIVITTGEQIIVISNVEVCAACRFCPFWGFYIKHCMNVMFLCSDLSASGPNSNARLPERSVTFFFLFSFLLLVFGIYMKSESFIWFELVIVSKYLLCIGCYLGNSDWSVALAIDPSPITILNPDKRENITHA